MSALPPRMRPKAAPTSPLNINDEGCASLNDSGVTMDFVGGGFLTLVMLLVHNLDHTMSAEEWENLLTRELAYIQIAGLFVMREIIMGRQALNECELTGYIFANQNTCSDIRKLLHNKRIAFRRLHVDVVPAGGRIEVLLLHKIFALKKLNPRMSTTCIEQRVFEFFEKIPASLRPQNYNQEVVMRLICEPQGVRAPSLPAEDLSLSSLSIDTSITSSNDSPVTMTPQGLASDNVCFSVDMQLTPTSPSAAVRPHQQQQQHIFPLYPTKPQEQQQQPPIMYSFPRQQQRQYEPMVLPQIMPANLFQQPEIIEIDPHKLQLHFTPYFFYLCDRLTQSKLFNELGGLVNL